ncbi:hypothetical protein FHS16_004969 [Paenibacillus endophyticus]|uniref:FHA domain-containing protein n=1 Tax=Paenibacillus endophyticus TaxID=1294268 RepID=A0A7W5GDC4_9BACL|nr:DUF6382 domain-containing protein [Paenibacillus endophyticus]MBB3154887.1 hypothetical protein [Paenibacillus endophyticus]
MQHFRIDFAMNQGHEMMIDRESGIYRSELDDIELQMLRNEQIPYLLHIDWLELDARITFRYRLSGKRMLLHRLQQKPLAMEEYYTLLLGVVDALYGCRDYMLRPEGCLLDEQFIFIGEKLHDIALAYVPIKADTNAQAKGAGDLLSLVVRFTSYIDRIDGEGLKRVLHHLTGKKWPLEELRYTLLDLIGGIPNHQSGSVQQREIQPVGKVPFPEKQAQNMFGQSVSYPNGHSQIAQEPKQPAVKYAEPLLEPKLHMDAYQQHAVSNEFDLEFMKESDSVSESEPESKGKGRWIGTAALLVAAACIWRYVYLASPTKQSLLLCAGITLLLLAFSLWLWRNGWDRKVGLEDLEDANQQPYYEPGKFNGSEHLVIAREHENSNIRDIMESPMEASAVNQAASLHVVAAKTIYPSVDPTVWLSPDQEQLELQHSSALWLQRRLDGERTRLELTECSFKIGRIGEKVSYADHANGISRLHLELEYAEGHYMAKDLGSKNGSLLNGQVMVPYKSYKLNIGDIVQLAGEQGPAYELKAGK